jgi:hypothetical protein
MKYGLTIDNQKYIHEKAKNKKNGIYKARGCIYRVRNQKITHIAYYGEVVIPYGNFNIAAGSYKWTGDQSGVDCLKNIKDE